ncbi:MAG: hypothetical protein KDI46_09085 [Alphaproteobacteria bacterium]|nr:hypothetical protein [Alphaproteobacteria bacterium]
MFDFCTSEEALSVWFSRLKALESVLSTGEQRKTLGRVLEALPRDLEMICGLDFLFADSGYKDVVQNTEAHIEFLRQCHVVQNAPSLPAFALAACCYFKIERPDLVSPILTASILAETPHDHAYHSNQHFREVLINLIRLLGVHNHIYSETAQALNEEQIALLLIAVCIHDLGHDGLGNTVKGVFEQGRLERRSFKMAEPYLRKAGLVEQVDLDKVLCMVLSTDASPLGDPASPVSQMKAAYRFHLLGENKRFSALNLSGDLAWLERDAKVALMACLLHEADVATSAGLSYDVTVYQTALFRHEIGASDARPEHVLDFLERICQRGFLSNAGQQLFGPNVARVYALSEQAMRQGNEPFPAPEHTDFILSFGRGDSSSAGRSDGKDLLN